MRRVAPAIGLFLLAPFVGEFLLGNLAIGELWLGLVLAPLYGGGALLIRELARRTGRGWPTMVLLAAAYALIEEGPVDQLLWNDTYAGQDLLHGPSYLPALGMSVELTQAILALHTVWSICVPIALVETFARARRTEPWLRTGGFVATAVIYVAGAVLVLFGNYSEEHFLASPAQLVGVGVVIATLIALGFAVGRRRLQKVDGSAPPPPVVGAAAFLATSLYWAPAVLITADWYEWIGVASWCVLVPVGAVLVSRWSRQDGWTAAHRFALAAGATVTYAWTSFPARPESGGSVRADLIGNAVFAAVAIVILLLAGWLVRADGRSRAEASLPP